ncbi:hypothetical protein CAEBREN_02636 [Caenorhabditis brenneri]|uniref:Uncharacterized protein n=1 Tax=Caenorhabditis brenneri TaxID=135651 RepID=G0N351_CAEBE|nr:hypothetical protein CAEBREN_02636 [Caenorhabditis brenneri]
MDLMEERDLNPCLISRIFSKNDASSSDCLTGNNNGVNDVIHMQHANMELSETLNQTTLANSCYDYKNSYQYQSEQNETTSLNNGYIDNGFNHNPMHYHNGYKDRTNQNMKLDGVFDQTGMVDQYYPYQFDCLPDDQYHRIQENTMYSNCDPFNTDKHHAGLGPCANSGNLASVHNMVDYNAYEQPMLSNVDPYGVFYKNDTQQTSTYFDTNETILTNCHPRHEEQNIYSEAVSEGNNMYNYNHCSSYQVQHREEPT